MSATTASGKATSPALGLRELLKRPGIVSCPGVHDGLSARIALEVGFDCLYMTGAGTCASRLGQPDLGLATLNDMRDHAEMIANLDLRVPLIADADTGYGGPNSVAKTLKAYARSNVAALHIEDQVLTKRCGHLANKPLVSTAEFVSRIRAASNARVSIGSDILIIARTDALASAGGLPDALDRLHKAVEAGADIVFLEGITTIDIARELISSFPDTPCLYNMVDWGKSPQLTGKQAEEIGFKVIIFPFASVVPTIEAIRASYIRVKKTGATGIAEGWSPQKVFRVVGLDEAMKLDQEAGGVNYEGGV